MVKVDEKLKPINIVEDEAKSPVFSIERLHDPKVTTPESRPVDGENAGRSQEHGAGGREGASFKRKPESVIENHRGRIGGGGEGAYSGMTGQSPELVIGDMLHSHAFSNELSGPAHIAVRMIGETTR